MPTQKQTKKRGAASGKKTSRKAREKYLLKEISLCLLMPADEKKFWADSVTTLPEHVLENVTRLVSEKNRTVEKYTRVALAQDKDHIYLAELKAKVEQIKRKAFAFDEESQKTDVDKLLSEDLKEL